MEDRAGTVTDPWHRVTAFEQRDAARAVKRLGGQVFRMYTISVEGGGRNNSRELSHIYKGDDGNIRYNEKLFRDLDRGIAIAGEEGVRIMIPYVDIWQWFGGYAEWGHLLEGNFWSDEHVKDEFKEFITWLPNRKNTVTGVLYKNDPTIMCWELGNELDRSNTGWTSEIAAHIKSIGSNHLVMDESRKYPPDEHFSDLNIDILTMHYGDEMTAVYAGQAADAGSIIYEGSKTADLPLYTDKDYKEGAFYRVIAVNESGDSSPSNVLRGE